MPRAECEIAIVGCGAAGMMAAIAAGRAFAGVDPSRRPRIVAFDGAKKLGAKILVAGGGRCNVTHHRVDPREYAGSSVHAIRKVLLQFDVSQTRAFFAELGVELKQEETGKLFPVSDDARTVLDALLHAMRDAGVQIVNPWRVRSVHCEGDAFRIVQDVGPESADAPSRDSATGEYEYRAHRVILATGGKSLPKSGSDGAGYAIARGLGHTIRPSPSEGDVFPALVPLTVEKGHWLTQLAGVTLPATLEVQTATGKKVHSITGSTLFTHVGISGPGPLDISRYYTAARREDRGTQLVMNLLPIYSPTSIFDDACLASNHSVSRVLGERGLPTRLVKALCDVAGVDAAASIRSLPRTQRIALAELVCGSRLPITGDRGWLFAEVTAGGVPLSELHLETMESRICPGLFVCGELCDVDGGIGGFNFQWAWASGTVAGRGAARAYLAP